MYKINESSKQTIIDNKFLYLQSNIRLPLSPTCPTSSLPLIGYFLQTLHTVPLPLRYFLQLQTVQMEHFGTTVAAYHLSILPAYFALVLALRLLLLLQLVFVLLLLRLDVRVLSYL